MAVSLAAAWPSEVQAVVLENTYTSISDMVDKLMPFLSPLKGHLLNIKWDSDRKIQLLTQPILFISGDSDELVPTEHMVRLHELATKSRLSVFFSVRGGTHNDTWERAGSSYYEVSGSDAVTCACFISACVTFCCACLLSPIMAVMVMISLLDFFLMPPPYHVIMSDILCDHAMCASAPCRFFEKSTCGGHGRNFCGHAPVSGQLRQRQRGLIRAHVGAGRDERRRGGQR